MGQEKKKQRKNIQTDINQRDFHSMNSRPSSQSNASASSALMSERPVNKDKPKRSKPIRKPTRAQVAKKDILYDTKKFDIVDAESIARENKKKKPSVRIRAVSVILVCLIVFFITAMIGIFIFCKVDTIEVIGKSVYSKDEIISATDYHVGDNLFFLPIAEVEETLPNVLPYIESAHIEREIPDKITIEVVACVPSAVITYNENYVIVGGSGKIIDIKTENDTSIMQVSGVEINTPTLGESVGIIDETQNNIFYQILTELNALSAQSEMTALELTDTSDIILTYQDRIKMEIGNATKLAYKIKLGVNSAQNESQYGLLDVKLKVNDYTAYFTPESHNSGTQQKSTAADEENVSLENVAKPFASNSGRGADIPDEPYTGNSSASDSDDSNDDNSSSEDSDENNV